jgi:hypothetical protein
MKVFFLAPAKADRTAPLVALDNGVDSFRIEGDLAVRQ